jgi:hypothetical protein
LRRGKSISVEPRRTVWAAAFARVGLWLAAFALFAQSLAVVAPPMQMADDAASVAAALGRGVVICSQADKSGLPAHSHEGCDQCPLCQAVANAALLDPPAAAAPLAPSRVLAAKLSFAPQTSAASAARAALPFARGPPSQA